MIYTFLIFLCYAVLAACLAFCVGMVVLKSSDEITRDDAADLLRCKFDERR